ncbi:MAG: VTT domain-containing protein [Candidatus Acidiferrum sp.]|jgi:membrane protein YqaA with SNARE-associated domain
MSATVPGSRRLFRGSKPLCPHSEVSAFFLAAFVDSSFLPLPLVTDLLLMDLSSRHPLRMPYYATMATLGSLGGCIWIYWIARKAGQAYYDRTHSHPPGRIHRLIRDYPTASVFLPAVAPFPVPFKPFVIAQGVFQVPFITFLVWTLVGRGALFFLELFSVLAMAQLPSNSS